MKIIESLRKHFLKWAIYNVLTFGFLSIFYIPYNLFWLQLSSLQFLKWLLTAGAFGSLVNIVMRPYVGVIVRYLDRRYGKKVPEEHVEWEQTIDEDGVVWWTEREKK